MTRHDALAALADRWRDASPREIASAQSYLNELCDALGVEKPRPPGSGYEFEYAVRLVNRDGAAQLWPHPQARREFDELFKVLEDRVSHLTPDLGIPPDVPLHVHARCTRTEILAACGIGERASVMPWQAGVLYVKDLTADLLASTLDKTGGAFSPTTRCRDYAISRDLIHWESQSVTQADSETGRWYREHPTRGRHVLLFARLNTHDAGFPLPRPSDVRPARVGAADGDYVEAGISAAGGSVSVVRGGGGRTRGGGGGR